MRAMILAAALGIPSSAPATPPAAAPAPADTAATPAKAADECVRIETHMADRPQARIVPRRLDELPPGRLYHTVLRQVGNCVIPAVVQERFGR